MSDYNEWSFRNKFNAFNTMKIIKHLGYWEQIKNALENDCDIPPPIAVTVDPSLACNLDCSFCNAKNIRDEKSMMSPEWLIALPRLLKEWGVKAVTIAGGGEPLMNKHIDLFLYACKDVDLPVGLITNGVLINKHKDAILDCCKWVGVSVDAGRSNTYSALKGTKTDYFNSVVHNIKEISNKGVEVTYKYLVCPENIYDIKKAIQIAYDVGCDQMHIRPMGRTWSDEDIDKPIFTEEEVNVALEEITEGRKEFENDKFKVFGITHKFGDNWNVENDFGKCYSAFMYLLIQPNGMISTCCDRRGDEKVLLAKNLSKPKSILNYWGTEEHIELFNNIDVRKCCRCTFSLHNQVFENMILEDKTFSDFI